MCVCVFILKTCLGSFLPVSLCLFLWFVDFLLFRGGKTVQTRQGAHSRIFVLTHSCPKVVWSPGQASPGRRGEGQEPVGVSASHTQDVSSMAACLFRCWRLNSRHRSNLPPSHISSFSTGLFFPNPGSSWRQRGEGWIVWKKQCVFNNMKNLKE